MSWFRSSLRRRSAAPPEGPTGPPRPARADVEELPLADLHALAAELGIPRYRLLRREQLVDEIAGEEPAVPSPRSAREPVAVAEPAEPEPQPEPEPEPQPESLAEPEPEPQPESLAEPELADDSAGEVRTGILDLVGEGYGFVRVDGLGRSEDDPYLSRTLVRRFALRRGDEVTGRVAARRGGERHARMVTIEGRSEERPDQPSLDDMPVERPSRPLLGPEAGSFAVRMVEVVAPLGRGQRIIVGGPPAAGASQLLRELTRGLARGGSRVMVVLVDVRPEEVPEWDQLEGVEVHAAPGDRPPREQIGLAELALERAKRLAEGGEDVVVVLDSISRLARAYGLARTRPGAEARTPELLAVEGAKRWFSSARDTGSGSLTLLAAGRVDSDSPLEAIVHETLIDVAAAVVRLDAELAARGMYPAVDAARSRTLGEEALLSDDRRRELEAMRGVMRSLDPPAAWEYAAARVRET